MPAAVAKPKPFKTYQAKAGEIVGKWYLVDAADQPLGRLAVPIARRLMGKDKPTYTAHLDTGDFVVVINAVEVKVHPKKYEGKVYRKWSGYPGGLHVRTFAEQQRRNPTRVIVDAVRRMLPKTLLGKAMLSKLKVYTGAKHPHAAQQPVAWAPLS
ncbi:MAG: 50S ribosomal protein L13 [Planctomycetota bacterium]|nr:50S ribosomal protein L13 [Planctomycetota bacterium]